MSLAVLARKTRVKQRLSSTTCGRIKNQGRSAGFVLNMTGRGANGIRTGPKPTAKYNGGGCKGSSGKKCGFGCKGCCEVGCKGGQRDNCCGGNRIVSKKCRNSCNLCWYQGLSQPAPQMSYGVYLARKSNGASRPSGRRCCDCGKYSDCSGNIAANPRKNPNTWKQSPNISAGAIIEKKRLSAITCARQQRKFKQIKVGKICISNKLDAKPPCSYYNSLTKQWVQPNKNPLTDQCTCYLSLKMKGRLGYTRINKNWCNTTKAVAQGRSASDQIASRKSRPFSCQCWTKPMSQMTIGRAGWANESIGFYDYESGNPQLSYGSFNGKINGANVKLLSTEGLNDYYYIRLILGPNNLKQNFIKSLSLVALDGSSITLFTNQVSEFKNILTEGSSWTWPGSSGGGGPQTRFMIDHLGQSIKVYWTPSDQSQINNTHLKCHKGHTLFKNPSVRCPSSSSGFTPVSSCI